jgi:hypothetical protein
MVKGLHESGSQRVSIMGRDMLLQPERSIEEMSKQESTAFFYHDYLRRRWHALLKGTGGKGEVEVGGQLTQGRGGAGSRQRRVAADNSQ